MNKVDAAIENVRFAQDFSGVLAGLYSTDLLALGSRYAAAYSDVLDAKLEGESEAASAMRRACRAGAAIQALSLGGRVGIRAEAAIKRAMSESNLDPYGVEMRGADLAMADQVSGFLVGAFLDAASRNSPEAVKDAAERAREWLRDAASGENQSLVDTALGIFKGYADKRLQAAEQLQAEAQARAAITDLVQAMQGMDSTDAQRALATVTDGFKRRMAGASPDEQAAFMARAGIRLVRDAAMIVAAEVSKGIGADKLPDWASGLAGRLTPEEVVVGNLRAAGADEFKRLYAGRVNDAKKLLRPAVQKMFNDQYMQAMRELEASIPDAKELRMAIDRRRNELLQEANADFDRVAHEEVAQQLGVSPEELTEAIIRVDEMAASYAAERSAIGQRLLDELRERHAVPAEQARSLRMEKVRVLPPAAKMLGAGHAESIERLLGLVGGGLRHAGAVEVMSVSDVKKRYPRKYAGRGVKRAFCARGDRFTLDGAEDFGVIGMGTESRGTNTLWHEMGHWLEHNNTLVAAIAEAWKARRTQGEKPVRLADIFPKSGYSRDEITLRDQFVDPYIGKVYSHPGTTEVVSMGMEYLHDPKHAGILASQDPDMLSLMVKIIEVVNG